MSFMGFAKWAELREQSPVVKNPMMANQSGADPVVSKMVQDIVGDKAGGPEKIKPKAKKVADGLRMSAVSSAKSGKFADALEKASQASKIQKISDES